MRDTRAFRADRGRSSRQARAPAPRAGAVACRAAAALLACLAPGCGERAAPVPPPSPRAPRPDPLPVQQARAYPETATGVFLSLADFEDSPFGEKGRTQVEPFSIVPDSVAARLEHVVNLTRTGVGAMAVDLPPHSVLLYRIPHVHDFRPWTLLSLAVHSQTVRDDLRVVLGSGRASWTSHHALLKPGWNNVLFDIQRLGQTPGFDASAVDTIGLLLADSTATVRLHLDDLMLIENSRRLQPAPEGVRLSKVGLDYRLELPGRGAMVFRQSADGLWRLDGEAITVQLAGPGLPLPDRGEGLELMGPRRVGHIEVLENNPVRVRIANTWFFPTRAGEWLSLAVRRIRWEHTFYGDGRWVVHAELNNAGGEPIGPLRLRFAEPVAWAGADEAAPELAVADFSASLGRWSGLLAPPSPHREAQMAAYLRPGRLRATLSGEGAFAEGDVDRDGFDQTQGCYFLRAKAGHCRFAVAPLPKDLLNPTFRVQGQWTGPVHVHCDGLALANTVRLEDGSVLFQIPGRVDRPMAVEVVGAVPPLAGR